MRPGSGVRRLPSLFQPVRRQKGFRAPQPRRAAAICRRLIRCCWQAERQRSPKVRPSWSRAARLSARHETHLPSSSRRHDGTHSSVEAESHQAGDHRRSEHCSRPEAMTAWRTRGRRGCGQGGGRNGRRDEHGAIMKTGSVVFGAAVRQDACCERRRCRIEQPRRLERGAIHGQLKAAVLSLFTQHSAPR